MMLRKLQVAGLPASFSAVVRVPRLAGLSGASSGGGDHTARGRGAVLYGGMAVGLLAGAAISAYWWKQRTRALNLLQATPFERAEELISSCESKIADIERAIEELKKATR